MFLLYMLIGSIQKYSLYFPLKTEIILNKKHRLVSPWWLPLHSFEESKHVAYGMSRPLISDTVQRYQEKEIT